MVVVTGDVHFFLLTFSVRNFLFLRRCLRRLKSHVLSEVDNDWLHGVLKFPINL